MDPKQTLFPSEELQWRLLCVPPPEKKDLLNVLRQQLLLMQEPPEPPLTNQGVGNAWQAGTG
jgi:hypothetical protein